MKQIYSGKFFLSILLMLMIPGVLFAAGTIKGVVKDAITGDPLPGANIVIKSIYHGTATGIDGEFVLAGIPDGSQVVSVSYLGYVEQELTVNVSDGETETIEVLLEVMSIQGEEVVITAQAYGQRAAINQQMAANTVINVVSAEKIEELPDANAAEALGRLPGVSLKRGSGEANQVVIRGLSPKYNNVTIEGIKMASTSDYDRSVDLSLVQSEMLAGMEVSKSLRPDMDADALGGTVNLRLQEAPMTRKINFAAEGGYANLGKDFANYKFTGGYSDRFFDKKFGVSLRATTEQKQMPSHRFSAGYSGAYNDFVLDENDEVVDTVLLTRTQNITLVDQKQTRHRTNGSLILDFKNDWWEVKFFNLLSIKNDDVLTRNNGREFLTQTMAASYTQSVTEALWRTMTRTHSLQNTFRFGASKLDVDLSTTYADVHMDDQSFPFVEDSRLNIDQEWLIYQDPKVVFESFGGLDSLDINSTYLRELQNSAQQLIDESYDARIDYELSFTLAGAVSGKLKLGGKYHQLTRSSNGTARYYSQEWGGSVARRQKFLEIFPWVETDLGVQRGINAANFVDPDYDAGKFLNGRYDLAWGADIDLLTDMQGTLLDEAGDAYYTRGVEDYQRDYEATEQLMAGYTMVELNIGPKLMILPGVRYEQNETEYFAFHIKQADNVVGIEPNPDSVFTERKNQQWFPSVNLKFKATDFLSIQGAVYKSTSRPSFRQISPLVIYPQTGQGITSNNPWLEPSSAWNYDLGVSIMKPKVGLFTIYGFYKEISDLIFVMNGYKPSKKGLIVGGPDDLDDRILGAEYYDPLYLAKEGTTDLPFNNPERAQVYGVEVSWQTNFWYLPGVLKGLVLDVNYTIMKTQTQYPYFESVVVGMDSSGFVPLPIYGQEYNTRTGPMEDQPASILNVILGWDYRGFSARVSYRYQSNTVEGLDARYSVFDRYYDTFSLMDLMLKQNITKNISAYANLTNILNHVDDYYFGEQPGHPALPTNSQFYGFRAQVGVKINL
ncbi:MAG: TonB-dependent receptor [Bacteroidota bacterium]